MLLREEESIPLVVADFDLETLDFFVRFEGSSELPGGRHSESEQTESFGVLLLGQVWLLVIPALFLVIVAFTLTPNIPDHGALNHREYYLSSTIAYSAVRREMSLSLRTL